MYPTLLLTYFISAAVILLASPALMVQVSLPYNKTGSASVLYNFILVFSRVFCVYFIFYYIHFKPHILKLKFVLHLFKKFCNISFVIILPEDGIDYGTYRLSRNFGKELPLYAAHGKEVPLYAAHGKELPVHAAQIPEEHRFLLLLLRSGSLKSTGEIVAGLLCAVSGESLMLAVESHLAICDASHIQSIH